MPEQRIGLDEDGAHYWDVRTYEFCALCLQRACEEGRSVCNGCRTEAS